MGALSKVKYHHRSAQKHWIYYLNEKNMLLERKNDFSAKIILHKEKIKKYLWRKLCNKINDEKFS
jgi:hypothetical protein